MSNQIDHKFTVADWYPVAEPMLHFDPQADISLQELVEVVKALKIGLSKSIVDRMSDEAKRHFKHEA